MSEMMSTSGAEHSMANKTTVARDSQTILLEGKTIPAKGLIHLYDSTPYMMNAGHVVLHIPCVRCEFKTCSEHTYRTSSKL